MKTTSNLKCKECEFKAKTKNGLATHMRAKHSERDITMHKSFDLNITNEQQAQELIGYLMVLKHTAGWQILKQIIEGNMAVLEQAIIKKVDPETNEKLTEVQADECRFKHSYLSELVEKPDRLIALFRKQNVVRTPTYDPYATDIRQVAHPNTNSAAPMSSTLKT